MPIKEPQIRPDETSRTKSIVRQAVLKSPIIVALQGNTPTVGKTRILVDYFTEYCLSTEDRITGSQHRALEGKIAEVVGPANRGLFKEFLFSEARCEEMADSGTIHLTDMSKEHADKILTRWEQMMAPWRHFKQFKANEANPDLAPAPIAEDPKFTDSTKPEIDDDVPDFMK